MPNAVTLRAGASIVKTLAFTLALGEEPSRITLLLTRTHAQSEHATIGRARCIILAADNDSASTQCAGIRPAALGDAPRVRFHAELRGVVPASICGGSYSPVFCVFAYKDERPPTGFEIDANQRFAIEVADDAGAVDAGPALVELA